MGTNFYWADKPEGTERHDSEYHIGKRSAAGYYCFDCRVSLFKDGENNVHGPRGRDYEAFLTRYHTAKTYASMEDRLKGMLEEEEKKWLKQCPSCGKRHKKEDLEKSAAGRELGFNKTEYKPLKGVHTCSSFTWCLPPHKLYPNLAKERAIVDEYGNSIRPTIFIDMLYYTCPIQFYDSIGMEFS